MKELVSLENVSFKYHSEVAPTIAGLSLKVERGDRILIQGRSGSGKSTLLYVLSGLAPKYVTGEMTGIRKTGFKEIGVVLQNPEAQIVTRSVRDEVAFALENFGLDPEEIRKEQTGCLSF